MKNFIDKTHFIVAIAATTILISPLVAGGKASAQTQFRLSPAELGGDLTYPNSSQRFFLQGNARLEQEIQRLQQQQVNPPAPALQISQSVREGQVNELQRQENWLTPRQTPNHWTNDRMHETFPGR